jgi:hypothetical protein
MRYELRIVQDEDAEDPDRASDECAFMVLSDGMRRRHFNNPITPQGWTMERAAIVGGFMRPDGDDDSEANPEDRARYAVFPLYAYNSGIALSLGRGYPWDSGRCGYVVVDKTETPDARKYAEAYVEQWNQFLSGDVWGYIIESVETCDLGHEHREHVDSCFGFYGREYAEQEGAAALAQYTSDEDNDDEPSDEDRESQAETHAHLDEIDTANMRDAGRIR